ncbi:hypothetical protein H6771_01240 [Candidatus Peribacteria bacterium]|nr:hypothetical protein [Candidatus Peribacteria bacterium]
MAPHSPVSLPGSEVLTQGESIEHDQSFRSSTFTWYARSRLVTTTKRLISHAPHIALGLLPTGSTTKTVPLRQVSGVRLEVRYRFWRILIGVTGGLLLFFTASEPNMAPDVILGAAVLCLLWGLTDIQTRLVIASSGEQTTLPVVFWEKRKARAIIARINAQLAERA